MKYPNLPIVTSIPDSGIIAVHNGAGLKGVVFSKLAELINAPVMAAIEHIVADGAGAHNSIYFEKNLGNALTNEQIAAIQNGTFTGMYIGSYWTINGVVWRIAHFNYYLKTGDTSCERNHIVVVPDVPLYTAQMHNTQSGEYESGAANTTEGGYAGSDMRTTNLAQAITTVKAAFPDHILNHRIHITNAVSNGRPSGGAWVDSEVDLMNENMVYGSKIFSPVSDGTTVPNNYTVEKSQLALFRYRPDLSSNRQYFWLRDVVSAASFAIVDGGGGATSSHASSRFGVRPAFCVA